MIIRLVFLVLLISSCKSNLPLADGYTLYLVRHAEKVEDGSRDPVLKKEGIQRADQLKDLLLDRDIATIYSSDYQRTRSTAQPLAKELNKDISLYNPRDLEALVNLLVSRKETALIVGHSNSTPSLANLILGQDIFEQFEESQYDQIIEIEYTMGRFNQAVLLY